MFLKIFCQLSCKKRQEWQLSQSILDNTIIEKRQRILQEYCYDVNPYYFLMAMISVPFKLTFMIKSIFFNRFLDVVKILITCVGNQSYFFPIMKLSFTVLYMVCLKASNTVSMNFIICILFLWEPILIIKCASCDTILNFFF